MSFNMNKFEQVYYSLRPPAWGYERLQTSYINNQNKYMAGNTDDKL